MKIKRLTVLLTILLLLTMTTSLWASGASSSSTTDRAKPTQAEEEPILTPEQRAEQRFNTGISMRDRAWKLEKKVADADEKTQAKLMKKVEKAYKNAAREFEQAALLMPGYYQAYGSLGYSLRKLGDYENALVAYGHALEIEPGYAEAIEYRGEAYLGLNRLGEARAAYMQLFDIDRPKADELMTAMNAWIEHHAAESGVDAESLGEFKAWVQERAEMATKSASLRTGQASSWRK